MICSDIIWARPEQIFYSIEIPPIRTRFRSRRYRSLGLPTILRPTGFPSRSHAFKSPVGGKSRRRRFRVHDADARGFSGVTGVFKHTPNARKSRHSARRSRTGGDRVRKKYDRMGVGGKGSSPIRGSFEKTVSSDAQDDDDDTAKRRQEVGVYLLTDADGSSDGRPECVGPFSKKKGKRSSRFTAVIRVVVVVIR